MRDLTDAARAAALCLMLAAVLGAAVPAAAAAVSGPSVAWLPAAVPPSR